MKKVYDILGTVLFPHGFFFLRNQKQKDLWEISKYLLKTTSK